MRTLHVALAGLVLTACTSKEYVCPQPIGKIIRDDCAVYRTRYDALKAEFAARVGPLGTSVKVGRESVRDPSQLMQLLAHRTHALCRDFNACRVSPLQYRKRREQTEYIFTAVGAINAQLKADLPPAEKAQLVRKLISLLSERPRMTAPTGGARRSPSPSPRRSGAPYLSWLPWYGTKVLPPQPSAKGPRVAHAKFTVRHVFRSGQGSVGYGFRARFLLRGKLNSDDLLTMRYGAKTADCRLSRSSRGVNGLVSVSCETPRKEPIKQLSLPITLVYSAQGEGKGIPIGTRTLKVLSRITNPRNGSRSFGVDHDAAARRVRLIFRPTERRLPPAHERPSLHAVLKLRDYRRKTVTARCWVNGKQATGAIAAYGRYSGQLGQFQDRDRYRQVGPGTSVAVKHPHVSWRRYDFPLPFYLENQGGHMPPKATKPWPQAGKWRCVVSIEGEPVREARFVVKANGRLEAIPAQRKQASAAWQLETRVIPCKHEEPLP